MSLAVRSVGAVALRGLLIFVRYPGWVISTLVWPVMFPAAYIFLASALAGPHDTTATVTQALGTPDYVGFMLVGTTLWMWVNITLWGIGSQLREEQLGGTLESNWLTPAPRWTLLVGSALSHAATVLWFVFIALVMFTVLYGFRVHAPGESLVLFLANFPWVYGLGISFASLVVWAKEVNGMVQMVRGIFLILCGMTYPVSVLPHWLQGVSDFLPLTHGISAIRAAALTGAGWADVGPDLAWLLGWGVLLLAGGLLAFNWTDRRMRRMGATGTY